MDKEKIAPVQPDFTQYNHHCKLDSTSIPVRLAIPREEKERAAAELVAATLIFDDELGICQRAINADVMDLLIALRHYAALDLEGYDTDDGVYLLYDMFKASGGHRQFFDLIGDDWREVEQIYWELHYIATTSFKRQHSLEHRLMGFLGDFLDVGDLTETLAKAHDINNVLVEAFDAVNAQKKAGERIGGNVLSFARKEPDPKN